MSYFKYRHWGNQKKPTWKEWHHYYLGMMLKLIGFIMIFWLPMPWWIITVLMVMGEWLIVDDWLQHKKQMKQWETKGYWTIVSFWHWFPYTLLYKWQRKVINFRSTR